MSAVNTLNNLTSFEKHIIGKLEKERREKLDRQNQAIETEVSQGLQALQAEADAWLDRETKALMSQKNQRIHQERQRLNTALAALKKNQQERLCNAVHDKLAHYTHAQSYVEQLLAHVQSFHEQHAGQVVRYVFALADQLHEERLSQVLGQGLISFSEHVLGGYQAYLKPNILADNSLGYQV